ncbi:MAG TPA: hypothetical protein PKI14_01670 [Fervidobacterium sp.]|nr:hypothetical protein [Fervidobacterium sp.]
MSKVGSFSIGNLNSNGSKFVKTKNFYLADGSNLYRILPPFGSQTQTGAIAKFWEIYWVQGATSKKPVVSIRKTGKDKVVLQADPLEDAIAAKKNELAELETKGAPARVIESLKSMLQNLNADKSYYLNVINPAGEIGVLKIKYTGWQALKKRLEELDARGVDAINPGPDNGIVFDFKRSRDEKGKVGYTVDIASIVSKDPATNKMRVDYQYMPIDDVIIGRMEKEARDLGTLFKTLSVEEQSIVASLDPKAIDSVFTKSTKVEDDGGDEGEDDGGSYTVSPKSNVGGGMKADAGTETSSASLSSKLTNGATAGSTTTSAGVDRERVRNFLNQTRN